MSERKASIKDYDVDPRYIYKGELATVYRAIHKDTGNEYAIKKTDKKILLGKEEFSKRIQEEVKLHIQLKHKSICEMYEVIEDENFIYQVLRFCENGDFMTYLKKKGKLSQTETQFYIQQIVSGLLYLNSHHITHRDLTLSNLLLTKEGNLMITDFGLATKITYSSPEMASTDMWSLGVIMYTMLLGQDSEPIETREKVRGANCIMSYGLSFYTQGLLDILLNKDSRISLEEVRKHPFLTNEHPYFIGRGVIFNMPSFCDSYTPTQPPTQSSFTNLSSSSSSLINTNSSIIKNETRVIDIKSILSRHDRVNPACIRFYDAKQGLENARLYFEASPVWSEEMRAIFDDLNQKLVDNKNKENRL